MRGPSLRESVEVKIVSATHFVSGLPFAAGNVIFCFVRPAMT